jgi:DNA-binding MarR family transcriptional regulator
MPMKERVNPTEAQRTLGALLRAPYEDLSRRLYDQLARRGFPELRLAHSPVFRHILPGGSRASELAERSNLTKQSMAYLVDSLAASGYVELVPDPSDRRAKLVKLTSKGTRAQRVALELSRQLEAEYAQLIGADKLRELRILLEDLFERLRH